MKTIKAMILASALLLALPTAMATNVPQFLRQELENCTAFTDTPNPAADCELFTSTGGPVFVEVYGLFGGASATMQYASDWDGTAGTFINVPVPDLEGVEAEVRSVQLTTGLTWAYQLVITGGSGESLTWSVASKAGV